MIYIDKKTVPYCFIEEKKFEWGEPYIISIPIFNTSVNPNLSNIEFTIEILGKNNFKKNLQNLYNILINKDENYRINNLNEPILNREFLIKKINSFIDENIYNIAPWENEFTLVDEEFYLKCIENDLERELYFEKKNTD